MPNIIIMTVWPMSARDRERFGISYLSSKGYRVSVFDISTLINPKKDMENFLVPDEISEDFIYKIGTSRDFKDSLERIAGDKLIITFGFPTAATAGCFLLLKALKIPYYHCGVGGYLPMVREAGTSKRILRSLASPAKIASGIRGRIRGMIDENAVKNMPLPRKIFVSGNHMYNLCRARYGFIDDRIVPFHNFDFDLYVDVKKNGICGRDHCLFLDARMDAHNSTFNMHKRLASAEIYYQSLNGFFDHVERKTGLGVVIAAHPRSHYAANANPFGSRPFLKDRSAELVARSAFVMLHGCTSFSFAALFRKPVIFIKTQEIADYNIDPLADVMAGCIGQKAVNIDSPEEMEGVDFSSLDRQDGLYERYIDDYVSFPGGDERGMWEIVHDSIEKDRP